MQFWPALRRAAVGVFCMSAWASAPLRGQRAADSVRARNRQLLSVVDSFFAHPLRSELWKAMFDSAQARTDVKNVAYVGMMPWRCYGDTAQVIRTMDQILLYGFIAGNMQHQLLTGVKQQESVAGLHGQLRIYDSLRAKVLNYGIPEMEIWREYRSLGRMPQLVDSLTRPHEPCAMRPPRFPGVPDLRPLGDSIPSGQRQW